MLNNKQNGIYNSIRHASALAVHIYYYFSISNVDGKMEFLLIFQELESDSCNLGLYVADIL